MARILVAEDAQYVQYLLKQVLADQGHQVFTAEDGYEAIKKLSNQAFDLLMLDLHLPGLDGIQIIEKIHPTWPKLPFLVLSGYVDYEIEVQLQSLGSASILRKPIDNDVLIKAVDLALKPARRVMIITDDPDSLIPLSQKLNDLGYAIENLSKMEVAESRIFHRPTHALILWDKEISRTELRSFCNRLRTNEEWLPIFLPETLYEDDLKLLQVSAIPGEDPSNDVLFTRLAETIGLQRTTVMNQTSIVQMAGTIDREDILEDAIRQAIDRRPNLLLDLRQVSYLSPYVKKAIQGLRGKAEELHLRVGFLVTPSFEHLPLAEWSHDDTSPFEVFVNQREAMKSFSGSVPT